MERLDGQLLTWQIQRLATVDSTQEALRRLVGEGRAEPGTVLVAEEQIAGLGRHGRRWISPPRVNLYCTAYYLAGLPLEQAFRTVYLAALAVHAALELAAPGAPLWIKWPNDLYWGERKLGGVLVSTLAGGGPALSTLVGIGLNVNARPEQLPERATSLLIETGRRYDRKLLLKNVLLLLDQERRRFERGPWSALAAAWWAAARLGQWGEVRLADTPGVPFRAVALADDGALILADAAGAQRQIYQGDLEASPGPELTEPA